MRNTRRAHSDPVWGLAISRNGRIAAGCGDSIRAAPPGAVKVWDSETSRSETTLPSQVPCVWSVAFSPDGQLIATGGGDLEKEPVELKVWRFDKAAGRWVERYNLRGHTRGISNVAFSCD